MKPRFNGGTGIVAICPDCATQSTFDQNFEGTFGKTGFVAKNETHQYQGDVFNRTLYVLYRCSGCGRGALGTLHDNGSSKGAVIEDFIPYAAPVESLPSNTPTDIREEYKEAVRCFNAGAFRACSAMARSTLEKILIANGYTTGVLAKKINEASTDGTITASRKQQAHDDLRTLGNDVLHEPWKTVSEEDATAALHYAQRILEDFYDSRKEVEAVLTAAGRQLVQPSP